MSKVKNNIKLSDTGISDSRVCRSLAGEINLEISGEDNAAKANDLANRLSELFPTNGEVRLSCSIKIANQSQNQRFDESITPTKVATANVGGCAAADIRLLKSGCSRTCVRWQGESIVDLSWFSPSMIYHIKQWKVMDNVETSSDHLYIQIQLHPVNQPDIKDTFQRTQRLVAQHENGLPPPTTRWAFKKIDVDLVV